MLVAAGSAVAGGVTGAPAMIKDRERSWRVVVSIVLGIVVALWVILEIAFPH